jgi:hypothetical protein
MRNPAVERCATVCWVMGTVVYFVHLLWLSYGMRRVSCGAHAVMRQPCSNKQMLLLKECCCWGRCIGSANVLRAVRWVEAAVLKLGVLAVLSTANAVVDDCYAESAVFTAF